jgi:hypothetical protein
MTKKNIYILLCLVATGLLANTAYYVYIHAITPPAPKVETASVTATTTPTEVNKNTYTLLSGKKVTIVETNPNGESLSTLTITTEGFASNTPIILETNKLSNYFYVDLDNDGAEELIITTVSQGSGSYGDVALFTSASSSMLLPITIPELTEELTEKNGIFEGYMGHDSFYVIGNNLVREFPTYTKNDTNSEPTGPRKMYH